MRMLNWAIVFFLVALCVPLTAAAGWHFETVDSAGRVGGLPPLPLILKTTRISATMIMATRTLSTLFGPKMIFPITRITVVGAVVLSTPQPEIWADKR